MSKKPVKPGITTIYKDPGCLVIFCFVLFAILAGSAFAQSIEGRDQAQAGSTVVLKGVDAKATNHLWLWDPDYGFDVFQCGSEKSLAFSASKPGKYRFFLVTVDADGVLHKMSHTVQVWRDSGDPGPTPPTDPPEPPPTEDDPLEAALKAVEKEFDGILKELNDPSTSKDLSEVFKHASEVIQESSSLRQAGIVTGKAFEAAMSLRRGDSRYKDWEGKFRKPLNSIINELVGLGVIENPKQFAEVIGTLADVLEANSQ